MSLLCASLLAVGLCLVIRCLLYLFVFLLGRTQDLDALADLID
jgi:hypothetical protein